MSQAKTINDFLSSAKLLHFTLPVLMVYLTLGTVARKYVGLYAATQMFFSAPVMWVFNTVPLPGMPVIVAMIFFNLTFKLIFKSTWNFRSSGIILTHIGAMLLLLGGLFTALFSNEGYIDLVEGQSSAIISDYHAREFVIIDDESNEILRHFDHNDLHESQVIALEGLTATILEYCQNCEIQARAPESKSAAHQGMAMHMQLSAKPSEMNDEENFAGLTFAVQSHNDKQVFVALEDVPQLPLFTVNDMTYRFELRRAQRVLPFKIQLIDFEKEDYPGTQMAKSYSSRVIVNDGGAQWESLISMNEPLRYKGYTFFQSSFATTQDGREVSVLAAVWNAGRVFPYLSGIVMCIGLLLHLFIRARKTFVLLPFIVFTAMPVQASETTSIGFEKLAQTPILHDGRIKPLDSFARAKMKEFSGQENGAMLWLIEAIFDPARAENTAVFKITDPEVRNLLNLEKRKSRLYSFREVLKGIMPREDMVNAIISADKNSRTPQQSTLLEINDKLHELRDILSSLSLYLPLSVEIPTNASAQFSEYAGRSITLADNSELIREIQIAVKDIVAVKGEDIESYSEEEQILAHLSYSISILGDAGMRSRIFKVIPDANNDMITPWQSMLQSRGDTKITTIWQDLAMAYHATDKEAWDRSIEALHTYYFGRSDGASSPLLTEYYYNKYNPFYVSFLLCGFAFILLTISVFVKHGGVRGIIIPVICLSVALQVIGISLRIYILDRPPVTTLYETVLFVSALAMAYLLAMAWRSPKNSWLWLCVVLGMILHILGFSHSQDGDSFVVLTAVLNTNFWLTTHVLCITAGYAFCAVTSILAHYALIHITIMRRNIPDETLFAHIRSAGLIALFFATIGTVLGGIWADQSWGRFWGWDPKENGALLIVLWLIWVIHGRISGQLRPVLFLCGLAYLSVILALSWFGVNLLNVGLHSYGFTDSAAGILGGFIIIETAIIIGLIFIHKERMKHA